MTQLFLVAHIAGQGVAIDADQIDSVVDIGEVVAVPRADPAIRGLTALRSRVVTVIDTGRALGMVPTPPGIRRAVITRQDGHHYAILVDSLEDVAPFDLLPLTGGGLARREGWSAVAAGMVIRDGEPILVIDLAALVPAIPAIAA